MLQLHLEHWLVRRLLQRFLSQGFVSDLSRACVIAEPGAQPRVVPLRAFGAVREVGHIRPARAGAEAPPPYFGPRDLKAKHRFLLDEARRELGILETEVREAKREPDQVQSSEKTPDDTPPNELTRPEMSVKPYVDDYVAGRGRDSREHELSAEQGCGELGEILEHRAEDEQQQDHKPELDPEIETDGYGNELIDRNAPVEPEPSREEPPPLDPDSYIPDRQPPPPEDDFRIGD